MKRKFLLFLSVMLVALMPLCASATLIRVVKSSIPSSWNGTVYIHYWGVSGSNWDNCPAMEPDGDEYLKYDIGDNSNFLLKSAKDGSGVQTHNIENITGDVIVKFTSNTTIEQVTSVEEGVLTYAVRGDFQEKDWSDFLLTGEGDELSVKITPTLKTSGNFGIRTYKDGAAQRDKWFGGNISISEETPEATLISAENSTWNLTLNREYTFTYNLSTKVLKITWKEETEVFTYAIRGDFQEDGWSDFKFEGEGDELSVKITPTLKTSGNFGIRTYINNVPQPSRWFGGNISISESTPEATLVDGPNSSWELTRNREYTFTYNLSTKKLKITWEAGEEPEVKDPIYIIGQVTEGNWQIMKGHALANIPGTNKFYTTNLKTTADGQISVVTRLGANENDWDSFTEEERFTIPVPQQDVNLGSFDLIGWTNHGNDKFKVGQGTFYAIVDMDAKTIEINKVSDLFPEALYLYGNLVNGHFDFNTDKPVVANRGEYNTEAGTYDYKFEDEIVIVTATEPNENGYFILVGGPHYEAPAEEVALFAEENEIVRVTPEEANWSAIDDKHRFVLADNTVKPLLASAVPTTADHCTSILDGHKVNLTVTLSEAGDHSYTLVDKGVATGVEGVEADANAPVEFFNLQGVRVANPENGIFIRRQGNKVTKVAIR